VTTSVGFPDADVGVDITAKHAMAQSPRYPWSFAMIRQAPRHADNLAHPKYEIAGRELDVGFGSLVS